MRLTAKEYTLKIGLDDRPQNDFFEEEVTQRDITASPQEVVEYLSTLLLPLSQMARGAQLNVLAYLLDMARLEAEQQLDP